VKKRGRGTRRFPPDILEKIKKGELVNLFDPAAVGRALADAVFAEQEQERKEIIEALKENYAGTRAVLNEWLDRAVAEGKMTVERAAEVRRDIDKIQLGCESDEP
jgi:hypothetical protein